MTNSGPAGHRASATVVRSSDSLRRFGLVAMPLLLIASICMTSFAMRAAHHVWEGRADAEAHDPGAVRAMDSARLLCTELAHESPEIQVHVMPLFSYSPRRKQYVNEYEVFCKTPYQRQYLIRLDSVSHHVFAFDLLDPGMPELAVARPAGLDDAAGISADDAEVIADRDLSLIGAAQGSLQLIGELPLRSTGPDCDLAVNSMPQTDAVNHSEYYVFRRAVSPDGHGDITIAIDRHTGYVGRLWNPSHAK